MSDVCEGLEEICDLDAVIPENTSAENIYIIEDHGISYQERQDAFEAEWIAFLKTEITANFEGHFHLWFNIAANERFIMKMEKLANKHFRGILGKESLTRLQIFVKQLQYGVMALMKATRSTNLETILIFVETFSRESFEAMEHWNWVLVQKDMSRLLPYSDEDLVDADRVGGEGSEEDSE